MTNERPPTELHPAVKRLALVIAVAWVLAITVGDRLMSFYRDTPTTALVALLIVVVVALYFVAGNDDRSGV